MHQSNSPGGDSVDDILSQLNAKRTAQAAQAKNDAQVDAILRDLGLASSPAPRAAERPTAPAQTAAQAQRVNPARAQAQPGVPAPAGAGTKEAGIAQQRQAPRRNAQQSAQARPAPAQPVPAARIVNTAPLVKPVVEIQTGTIELPSIQDYSAMQSRRGAEIQREATEAALARATERTGAHTARSGALNWEADDKFRAFFAKSVAQDVPGGRIIGDTGAFDTTSELPPPRVAKSTKRKGRGKKKNAKSFLARATQDADERFLTGELDLPLERAGTPDAMFFDEEQSELGAMQDAAEGGLQELSFDTSGFEKAGGPAAATPAAPTPAQQSAPAAAPQPAPTPHFSAPLRREPASGRAADKQRDVLGVTLQVPGANTAKFNTLEIGEPETSSAGTGTFQRVTISMPLTDAMGQGYVGEEPPEEEDASDYNHLSDAPAVAASLHSMRLTRVLRICVTGLVSALLFYLGAAAHLKVLPQLPNLQAAAVPLVFLMVNLVLLTVAAASCLAVMGGGLVGLFGKRPSADTLPALAVLAAMCQIVCYLVKPELYDMAAVTLFAPVAALGLCTNAVGKWLHSLAVSRSFELASAGYDHSAAFLVPNNELTRIVCSGLTEPNPLLLVSRPTELVRGFMRQSFSVHASDRAARKLAWLTLVTGVLCGVLYGLKDWDLMNGFTGAAAAICLAAPLASSLVYAVPALRMQKAAAAAGAVVPGPSAVQNLGLCNTVLLNGRDLFPSASVRVRGMKPFNKSRIDLVMLYAASIAFYNCDTLRDAFMSLVDNKRGVLYPVENPQAEPGCGFSGWIENHETLLGNRMMMRRHGISVPAKEYERKYTKDDSNAVYLAVGGRVVAMFMVSYLPDAQTQAVLADLENNGISVLIQTEDFNLTAEMVATTYHVSRSFVKVLTQSECEMLASQTEYMEESEGYMTHTGGCSSFVGGLRAAASAAAYEHLADVIETIAVLLTLALCVVLSFSRGLASLPLWGVVLYLATWLCITLVPPALKK